MAKIDILYNFLIEWYRKKAAMGEGGRWKKNGHLWMILNGEENEMSLRGYYSETFEPEGRN